MAHTFPPVPDRPDGPAGNAQHPPRLAKRSAPRSPLRSALPRLMVLAVTLLSGTPFRLASQHGHVVVLFFMATGCAGCEPGSHDLAKALLSAKVRGARALAIDLNTADHPVDLQAFVQSVGIPASAPVQWGIDTTGAIASAYHVQTLETTVVIDPRGQIAYRSDGAVPPEQLAQIVRNLA